MSYRLDYHAPPSHTLYMNNYDEDVPLATRQRMWVLHDGASAHSSRNVTWYLDSRFQGRWIGRNGPVAWPLRSPDLTPADCYSRSHLKIRPTMQHTGRAVECHSSGCDDNTQTYLTALSVMVDRFTIFCKPSVTDQMPFCSQLMNTLSTTTLFVGVSLLANELVPTINLYNRFCLSKCRTRCLYLRYVIKTQRVYK
jgi:hypothetical protein